MTLALLTAHMHSGGKKEQEEEQNGYESSVVAAVNFSTEVCFDFSENGEKCSCPEQCCFLHCNCFSLWSSWRRAMPVQESQLVGRITNLQVCEVFVSTLCSLSSVFVCCYCIYGMSVTR